VSVAKTLAAAIGTTVTVVTAALADDVLDISETAGIVAAAVTGALTVYAVWRTPNRDRAPR
jgi:hypothetical protein